MDMEYIMQKDDMLQQKISTGLVAMGLYVPNMDQAQKTMAQIDPSFKIRYIPWPKQDKDYGFYDIHEGGFWRVLINDEYQHKERLTQYFDWLYSDEGIDILTWGPESAGLWEMKDGKKVFKDQDLADALINGTGEGMKGPEYYGLWNPSKNEYSSRAAIASPMMLGYNPMDSRKSYEAKLNIYHVAKGMLGLDGFDFQGRASYGNGSDTVSEVATYFWGQFTNDRIGSILNAKTEAEFEKAWNEQLALFKDETNYEAARQEMIEWFNNQD